MAEYDVRVRNGGVGTCKGFPFNQEKRNGLLGTWDRLIKTRNLKSYESIRPRYVFALSLVLAIEIDAPGDPVTCPW